MFKNVQKHLQSAPISKEIDRPVSKQSDRKFHKFANPLAVLLTIFYYFLIIPFKPVYNHSTGRYYSTKSIFQKVICYILWTNYFILNIFKLPEFFQVIANPKTRSALSYFIFLSLWVYRIVLLRFLWVFTQRSERILDFLNSSLSDLFTHMMHQKKMALGYIYLMMGIMIVNVIIWPATHLLDLENLTISINPLLREGKQFLHPIQILFPDLFQNSLANPIIYAVTVGYHVSTSLVYFLVEALFMGPLPYILWAPVVSFFDYVLLLTFPLTYSQQVSLSEHYTELKLLSKKFNGLWGLEGLLWVIILPSQAILYFNAVSNQGNVFQIEGFLLGFVGIISCYIFSAEVYRKMECFYVWLWENKDAFTQSAFPIKKVLKEVKLQSIGMSVTGVFKLNYCFAAQFGAVMITVFLVSFESSKFHAFY